MKNITLTDMIDHLVSLRDELGNVPVEVSMNGGEYGGRLDWDDLSRIVENNSQFVRGSTETVVILDW